MRIKSICVKAFLVSSFFAIVACKNNSNQDSGENGFRQLANDTIEITENSNLIGKLKTEKVILSPYKATIKTTGEITPIPTEYAEIAAPLPGRVVKTHIHLGQAVRVGSPLFDIASSEYSEIAKEYIKTHNEMQQAERALNRVKDLYDNHVASSREVEEAQTAYNIARGEYNHALAVTKEYQINTESLIVGRPMTVKSPIHGKVLKNDIVIGEYLKEDAEAKVIIANLNKVWLKANISEKDAPLVNNIQNVDIRTVANNDSVLHGKIVYVGGMLDPDTRTLQTIIECDNHNGELMPNMYADITLYQAEKNCIIIPKEAVLQSSEGRYVMRKVGKRIYCRTRVSVHSSSDGRLIVLDGLKVGDEIITKGVFYLAN
jgi:cobalt-zinc-cadmium efflux system membrane fusion protein